MKIGFLAIGDELLDGRVLDRNGAFLGAALAERELSIQYKTTTSDDFKAIASALETGFQNINFMVISGGLGPTTDDMTSEAVSRWAGKEQQFIESAWEDVQRVFQSRGLPCPDTNKRQALFPEGANVLANPIGTAPGFMLESSRGRVVCLPGVHREFCAMLQEHVFPLLPEEETKSGRRHIYRLLGARESSLAAILDPIPLEPGESVHYQASFPDLAVLLRGRQGSEERWKALTGRFKKELAPWLYNEGEGRIGEAVVGLLQEHEMTMSTAESCTGGLIGQLITAVPGASRVYLEGAITYSNEAKYRMLGVRKGDLEAHGAVSREVVIQMAEGSLERSGSSVAIATSGVAGPGGGSPEKPVGTVHVALAVRGEAVVHKLLQLRGSRQDIQIRSAWSALHLLVARLKKS